MEFRYYVLLFFLIFLFFFPLPLLRLRSLLQVTAGLSQMRINPRLRQRTIGCLGPRWAPQRQKRGLLNPAPLRRGQHEEKERKMTSEKKKRDEEITECKGRCFTHSAARKSAKRGYCMTDACCEYSGTTGGFAYPGAVFGVLADGEAIQKQKREEGCKHLMNLVNLGERYSRATTGLLYRVMPRCSCPVHYAEMCFISSLPKGKDGSPVCTCEK